MFDFWLTAFPLLSPNIVGPCAKKKSKKKSRQKSSATKLFCFSDRVCGRPKSQPGCLFHARDR